MAENLQTFSAKLSSTTINSELPSTSESTKRKDCVIPITPVIALPEVTPCESIPKKIAHFLKKSPSLPPRKGGYCRKPENDTPKKAMSESCLENQGENMVPLISSGSYKLTPKQEQSFELEALTNGYLALPSVNQPRNSAASLKVHFEEDLEVDFDEDCRHGLRDSFVSGDGTSTLLHDELQPRTQSRASTCTAFSLSGGQDGADQGQSDEEGSEDDELKPPDGGYGWVIVFASFLIHLIADGITFSFGVIFIELLDYFKEGRGKTAWIASLFMSLPLFAGPVASSMTDRFGCKAVTIAGGLISSTGFILSAFTDSIEVLFITFGVIPGLGLSFCYVAAIASVAYYFEARRSLAIGLAVCGSGIGTFVFAPLTQLLLDEYGWRGTTLILAGIFLNLCVCGMLMRELEVTSQKRETKRRLRYNSQTESIGGSVAATSRPDIPDYEEIIKTAPDDVRMCTSLLSLPTFVYNGEKVPLEVLEPLLVDPSLYSIVLHLNPQLVIGRSFEDHVNAGYSPKMLAVTSQPDVEMKENGKGSNGHAVSLMNRTSEHSSRGLGKDSEKGRSHPAHTKHLQTHLLKNIRVNKNMLTHRCAMLNLPVYRLRASSCPDLYRNSMVILTTSESGACGGIFEDLQIILLEMCDVSNLVNPKFVLFLFSNFLLYAWYDVPYIYLVDSAVQRGISKEKASFLSSMIGILNTLGGVLLGFLGDKPWMNPHLTYAVLMCLCGLSTGVIPLLSTYEGVATAAGLFGLSIAANYSLTAIILVDLLSLDKFTNAYGFVLLIQGIGNLIGPPLAGWIFDETGDYDLSFYVAGAFVILSGIILFVPPLYNSYTKFVSSTKIKGTGI